MIKTLYNTFRHWSSTGSVWIISDTHFDDPDCKHMDEYWISSQFRNIKNFAKKFKKNTDYDLAVCYATYVTTEKQ